MVDKAGMKELALGHTGRFAARNVRIYREGMGLSYARMSEILERRGHRIPVLGLRRIEACARRMDVDDLVAIAGVLGVTPVDLLMPNFLDSEDEPKGTGLPEDLSIEEARAWVKGNSGLDLESREEFWANEVVSRTVDFDKAQEEAEVAEETAKASPFDKQLEEVAFLRGRAIPSLRAALDNARHRRLVLRLRIEDRG